MNENAIKRKIKSFKPLEGGYIHKKEKIKIIETKTIIEPKMEEIQETKKEQKNIGSVGQFQLVVIKLPWYKKAFRKLMGFLGLIYE